MMLSHKRSEVLCLADEPLGQRRYRRIVATNAVLLTRVDGEQVEDLAATRTIGEGGCGVVTHESLGVDALVRILISIQQQVVRAMGRVVYEHPLGGGKFEVGVEFLNIGDEEVEVIESLLEKPASV